VKESTNQAGYYGGGIYNWGTVTLNPHSYITENTALLVNGGGGIYNIGGTMNLNGGLVTRNHPNDIFP